MSRYKHIFFDLDRTLWDFNKNSMETLHEACKRFELEARFKMNATDFISSYMQVNDDLWDRYRKNEISKEQLRDRRFNETLRLVGIENRALAMQISTYYLANCPLKSALIPFVSEVLDYLNKRYELHIITNGFGDAQRKKMETTGIRNYFNHLIISEEIGHKKPSKEIFFHAVQAVGGNMEQSIMIGDDLHVDILGAAAAGMDQVYFNPAGFMHQYQTTYQVSCLSEIKSFL